MGVLDNRQCVVCGLTFSPDSTTHWTDTEECLEKLRVFAEHELQTRREAERLQLLDAQLEDLDSEVDKAREALSPGTKRFVPSDAQSPPIETVDPAHDIDLAIALLTAVRSVERIRMPDLITIVDLVRGLMGGVLMASGAVHRGGDVRQVDHLSEGEIGEDD